MFSRIVKEVSEGFNSLHYYEDNTSYLKDKNLVSNFLDEQRELGNYKDAILECLDSELCLAVWRNR